MTEPASGHTTLNAGTMSEVTLSISDSPPVSDPASKSGAFSAAPPERSYLRYRLLPAQELDSGPTRYSRVVNRQSPCTSCFKGSIGLVLVYQRLHSERSQDCMVYHYGCAISLSTNAELPWHGCTGMLEQIPQHSSSAPNEMLPSLVRKWTPLRYVETHSQEW